MKTVRLCSPPSSGRTVVPAERITKNRLIGLRETNPAIPDMFRERDTLTYRELLPWSGEFAGKYITGAWERPQRSLPHPSQSRTMSARSRCPAASGWSGSSASATGAGNTAHG